MVKRDWMGNPTEWAKYYKMHWEVWPICVIISVPFFCYIPHCLYMLNSRHDVEWYRGQKTQFVQALTHPKVHKYFIYDEEWIANPELANLYKEMDKKEKENKAK